ncbi:signal peptidase I [Moraxella osloensis]|uniref:Signal peptidase I n=1 Tax=Faucicola osloensis TaxID=34062 RepID=A0A378QC05_FAUOS|nr:signal peptidase I [Moraxella osloensis]AME01763.1 S26 family signal peptidase [Moraxella osloensis]OBX53925.1 signal peptidase I [Moraxella osloensis]QPT42501.1 signal peptidase I [Moraxella osloensis]STY98165.1 Signal peptidase I [Moraxella osloensis]
MDFDFNLILVPATLILGAIWLLDKLVLKQKQSKGLEKSTAPVRWAYDFFPILAIVLVVRSFLIEPFNIPSSSMVPTLYTGDFIAVNKYAYGIRLPLVNTKVLDLGAPQHGDVVVFRFPLNPKQYYIKRVIGVGGDTVSFNNGQLSVNGKAIPTTPANFTPDPKMTAQLYPPGKTETGEVVTAEQAAQLGNQEEQTARYLQESPSSNHQHLVRYLGDKNWFQYASFLQQVSPQLMASQGQQWQLTVPKGHYFVMGDNRDRSADSRFWGFVPDENLAGKAVYVWTHKASGLSLPTFNRNGAIH